MSTPRSASSFRHEVRQVAPTLVELSAAGRIAGEVFDEVRP
ncbi:MAG: hypothetical protein ACREL9_02145 [Gemmatimonadales bacterium]